MYRYQKKELEKLHTEHTTRVEALRQRYENMEKLTQPTHDLNPPIPSCDVLQVQRLAETSVTLQRRVSSIVRKWLDKQRTLEIRSVIDKVVGGVELEYLHQRRLAMDIDLDVMRQEVESSQWTSEAVLRQQIEESEAVIQFELLERNVTAEENERLRRDVKTMQEKCSKDAQRILKLEELLSHLSVLKQDKEDLTVECEKKRKQCDEAEHMISNVKAELDNLQKIVEELQQANAHLRMKMQEGEEERQQNQSHCAKLQDTITNLEKALDDNENYSNTASAAIGQLHLQNQALHRQVDELNQKLIDTDVKKEEEASLSVQEKITGLQSQLNTANSELSSIKCAFEDIKVSHKVELQAMRKCLEDEQKSVSKSLVPHEEIARIIAEKVELESFLCRYFDIAEHQYALTDSERQGYNKRNTITRQLVIE